MGQNRKPFLVSCFIRLIKRLVAQKKTFKALALLVAYKRQLNRKRLKKLTQQVRFADSSQKRKEVESMIDKKMVTEAAVYFGMVSGRLNRYDKGVVKRQIETAISLQEKEKIHFLIIRRDFNGARAMLITSEDRLLPSHFNEEDKFLTVAASFGCRGGGYISGCGRKMGRHTAYHR